MHSITAYRRSVHGLAGTSKLSDERVQETISKVLSFALSSYNTQPVCISVALGEKHKELWSIILKEAEPVLTSINLGLWQKLGPMFQSHKAAYGSTHKASGHIFSKWGDHTQGIYRILVWTALELGGVGANLQHMNAIPAIEATIKKFAGVPDDYKLKAHLNYGDEQATRPEKPMKLPIDETLIIL
ncbi:putative nitroreductase HBN1 [Aspergillus udagawae]|uniref:Nitroreductase HBN1 n=1 Tax=Aspergillus udagawae TaxID=91492 RepID=A0ABQ1B6V7_9EURO|nr:putative nitroreductase HBN1 [Aspergillus udagawae]